MKALQPSDAMMTFVLVQVGLPQTKKEVLVRGWGEKQAHYVYDFARYEVETACRRWIARDNTTLWFEPIEWASLPQPKED